MPTFTTEGIILKRTNYGEADRMLTILTPFRGKIRVVAKGVRRITSRRGGNVEVLNRVRLQLFQGTGLKILTEAESLETFQKIKSDLILMSYASHSLELIDKLIPEEQTNPGVYNLLTATLQLLEKNPRQIFIRAFEVKLLSTLGFWSTKSLETTMELKKILTGLEDLSWRQIHMLEVNEGQSLELGAILRYYIERILESKLKSLDIVKKLKSDG